MGAQAFSLSSGSNSPRQASPDSNGAPHEEGRRHEGNEGNEGKEDHHESHEGHEGKEGQCHRQGQDGQGHRLPWLQGEDRGWHDQGQPRQEQEGQDCVQGCVGTRQEGLCHQRSQGLVRRYQGSPQDPEPQRLCPCWRQDGTRQGALCQGQVAAQVKEAADVRSCCPRWASSAEPASVVITRRGYLPTALEMSDTVHRLLPLIQKKKKKKKKKSTCVDTTA